MPSPAGAPTEASEAGLRFDYGSPMASRLSLDEARERLAAVPGWELEGDALVRTFIFANFARAFGTPSACGPPRASGASDGRRFVGISECVDQAISPGLLVSYAEVGVAAAAKASKVGVAVGSDRCPALRADCSFASAAASETTRCFPGRTSLELS